MARILTIDDDPLFLEVLLDLLLEAGYQAIGTHESLTGFELAKQQKPDLIICDVRMPILDGFGFLKRLRQEPVLAQIPFIFLTAEKPETHRGRALALGANAYLRKPFAIAQLMQMIETQVIRS